MDQLGVHQQIQHTIPLVTQFNDGLGSPRLKARLDDLRSLF